MNCVVAPGAVTWSVEPAGERMRTVCWPASGARRGPESPKLGMGPGGRTAVLVGAGRKVPGLPSEPPQADGPEGDGDEHGDQREGGQADGAAGALGGGAAQWGLRKEGRRGSVAGGAGRGVGLGRGWRAGVGGGSRAERLQRRMGRHRGDERGGRRGLTVRHDGMSVRPGGAYFRSSRRSTAGRAVAELGPVGADVGTRRSASKAGCRARPRRGVAAAALEAAGAGAAGAATSGCGRGREGRDRRRRARSERRSGRRHRAVVARRQRDPDHRKRHHRQPHSHTATTAPRFFGRPRRAIGSSSDARDAVIDVSGPSSAPPKAWVGARGSRRRSASRAG